MRLPSLLLLGAACEVTPKDAATPTPTDTGATDPSTPTTPVGNDVDLDRYPPVVIATDPPAGTLGLDVATTTISATFSKPMAPDSWAWVTVNYPFPEIADTSSITFVDGDTTNVLDGVILEPDVGYQLYLNDPFGIYASFVDPDGNAALAYPLIFATGTDPALLEPLPGAVIASAPVAGSADVDPALTELTLTFSKDVAEGFGALAADQPRTFPAIASESFADARTLVAEVALTPSATYAVWVDGYFDTDGNPIAPWLLTFRTAD